MGKLTAQQYFQLHSNFNDIVNFTLDAEFLGSNFIAIGGITFFLFDLSKWMLRTA